MMKGEEYPERICCTETARDNVGTRRFVCQRCKDWRGNGVEYVRADLVPQWHDAKEQPSLKDGYSVQLLVQNKTGEYGTAWFTTMGWCSADDTILLYDIVAWCQIPKRNTKAKH